MRADHERDRSLRDVGTELVDGGFDMEQESIRQRLEAWDEVSVHSVFDACYDSEDSLTNAMMARLYSLKMTEKVMDKVSAIVAEMCNDGSAQIVWRKKLDDAIGATDD
jgi:DNA helicase TIP49 (TBP-interacting protein)